MNNEITTQVAAIELSEQELDTVAGGLSLSDVHSFASGASNTSVGIEDIFSSANQGMMIG
jgi:hypothetical protein